jgi:L,D-transpeptidase catalytic domain
MRAVRSAILALALSAPAAAQVPSPAYRFESLPKTLAELVRRFTPAQIDILEMLNRRDRGHLNERGVSFHLFDLPGYPASHTCVRLLLRDAQWFYGWGEQWKLDETKRKVTTPGTPVVVLGTYPFGAPPAWLSLESLATPIALPDLAAPPGNGNGAARPAHQLGTALQHADRH